MSLKGKAVATLAERGCRAKRVGESASWVKNQEPNHHES